MPNLLVMIFIENWAHACPRWKSVDCELRRMKKSGSRESPPSPLESVIAAAAAELAPAAGQSAEGRGGGGVRGVLNSLGGCTGAQWEGGGRIVHYSRRRVERGRLAEGFMRGLQMSRGRRIPPARLSRDLPIPSTYCRTLLLGCIGVLQPVDIYCFTIRVAAPMMTADTSLKSPL